TPFPLPSSCGNGIASRPMTGNTTAHHNGSRQSRGACARTAPAARTNQYATNPTKGPITIDQTTRGEEMANGRKKYCDSFPKPIHATTVAITQVANAGISAGKLNVPSKTSRTKSVPPNGAR